MAKFPDQLGLSQKRESGGLTVSLIRKTLTECRALGERNQLAGLRMTKARILNGGWYENRASFLTLKTWIDNRNQISLKLLGRCENSTYPSMVEIANWNKY